MGKKKSETQLMQSYSVLFENVKKDTVLAAELAEYGYNAAAIAQGEALYNNFVQKYEPTKQKLHKKLQRMPYLATHLKPPQLFTKPTVKRQKLSLKTNPMYCETYN